MGVGVGVGVGGCFSDGGRPMGGDINFGGGGGGFEKNRKMWGGGRHFGKPWRVVTLKNLLGKGCIWQGEWSHYEVCFSKGCI